MFFHSFIFIMTTWLWIQIFTVSANITCVIRWGITYWCFLYSYIPWYDMCCPCQYTAIIAVVRLSWYRYCLFNIMIDDQNHFFLIFIHRHTFSTWKMNLFLNLMLCTLLFKWTPNVYSREVLCLMRQDNLNVRIS